MGGSGRYVTSALAESTCLVLKMQDASLTRIDCTTDTRAEQGDILVFWVGLYIRIRYDCMSLYISNKQIFSCCLDIVVRSVLSLPLIALKLVRVDEERSSPAQNRHASKKAPCQRLALGPHSHRERKNTTREEGTYTSS